jgi:hypothetical protein
MWFVNTLLYLALCFDSLNLGKGDNNIHSNFVKKLLFLYNENELVHLLLGPLSHYLFVKYLIFFV